MKTGFRGTFVISWSQTETDGQKTATTEALTVGARWRWTGDAVRVDGPRNLLLLDGALGAGDLRKRAAQRVRRLVGAALAPQKPCAELGLDCPLQDSGFTVTDGRRTFTVTLIEVGIGRAPLAMFFDQIPPADVDLCVVHRSGQDRYLNRVTDLSGAVICFAGGTSIHTGTGEILIEDLREGDLLQTKDDGLQPIQWIGVRRVSGARLYALPEYRPIRIRAGALYDGAPGGDLLVSPDHRLLLGGTAAQILFNTAEVLVAAKDLVNGHDILVDHQLRDVTYYHLMLPQHQIVWANGVECESFHPASMAMEDMEQRQWRRLLEVVPEAADDPHAYGVHVRRNLSASEAAILLHVAA